ncbi:DUF6392 family protein [Pseudomonas sp. 148P]|uniref:DUF6392 family protein n=1 Tax=Pseudomonas ulcerans TaxID=3115852 RepID=A0ABU7HK08_9PSED|nr:MULTISPECIES: DUF6392 family protein [unclassified Pseudomonas]MEE1922217.1 DUF6392 family protein [Pseudomonas sp. 147P]MEE1931862.1 DUF6392 family protein [Pseudomonas sp. 148P]
MRASELEKILEYLGRSHADLVANHVIPDLELQEIYPGSERRHITLEQGLELDFLPDDKVFTALFITLRTTTPSTTKYLGELPEEFFSEMDQEMVIDLFGDPVASRGPVRMPEPIGQTGGWASYIYDEEMFPGVELQFQYTADMQVKTIVFALGK